MYRLSQTITRRFFQSVKHVKTAATICLLSLAHTIVCAETKAIPTESAEARTLISSSLTAMGGVEAWKMMGAATAEAEVSSPGLKTSFMLWSDDWSLGTHHYKHRLRDRVAKDRPTQQQAAFHMPNQDLVSLAPGYPAASLSLSLSNSSCGFYSAQGYRHAIIHGIQANEVVVVERCFNTDASDVQVEIEWSFDRHTNLPLRVSLPVKPVIGSASLRELVTFTDFQRQNNMLLPSCLTIIGPSGKTETVRITNTKLTESLQDSMLRADN